LLVFETQTLVAAAASRDSLLKFYARALGLFSVIAMVLAAVGIFGLMNFSVTDRFHEIGIRVALGASRARVVWLVLSYGIRVASAGLILGVGGALAAMRIIERFLFEVKPWDPLTFSLVALFLLAVAMGACLLPAFRAVRVDPVVALRRE
jgi:putative ABC transport system permease protein